MRDRDSLILESLYDSISNDKFTYPLNVYHGTDFESAKDIKKNGLNIDKCERGYFGKAFYVTTDKELAKSNYADFSDDEGGVVLEFEMNPKNKILDLRNSEDWDTFQKLEYKGRNVQSYMGFDEISFYYEIFGYRCII
jgi:hypothetical protein